MIITLIIGLPGSGKTWYARNVLGGTIVDDIQDLKDLPNINDDFTIIDVNFCDQRILNQAKHMLRLKYTNVSFQEIYFENNPKKARRNVERRNDGRNVEGTIKRFTAIYNPPHDALEIFSG